MLQFETMNQQNKNIRNAKADSANCVCVCTCVHHDVTGLFKIQAKPCEGNTLTICVRCKRDTCSIILLAMKKVLHSQSAKISLHELIKTLRTAEL